MVCDMTEAKLGGKLNKQVLHDTNYDTCQAIIIYTR